MRFYTDVLGGTKYYMQDIIDYPWSVFAIDLLYFLSCEYETGWIPYTVVKKVDEILVYKRITYTPHPLSPFTNDMRRTIKYGILPPDETFDEIYNHMIPPDAEDKLARFVDMVEIIFENLFSSPRTTQEIYIALLFVGKLAVICHLHGIPDAPDIARNLIENVLHRIAMATPGGQAFAYLKDYAIFKCNIYENEKRMSS